MQERKKVKIQDLDEEEWETQNVNHIQHFSTSSSKEPHINVVTTRSQAPMGPHPIIGENSSHPNNSEQLDNWLKITQETN